MQLQENSLSVFLTPQQAWDELQDYRAKYYNKYAAAYSGIHQDLIHTAESGSFWKRNGKCRVHVPVGADIAATSADLLFGEEPRFLCSDDKGENVDCTHQQRIDKLVKQNNLFGLLNEAAETCAALGDVYLKLNWRTDEVDHPIITVVQGDTAWPEYVLGTLKCIHFFTLLKRDNKSSVVWRIHERYERGKIMMTVFKGGDNDLGKEADEAMLTELGYERECIAPVDEMLAVHIANMKPNRMNRSGVHGRSDFDGLRDLMDSLDEAYSSWMRDIRLAKARLIVPAEYLRRKPSEMFQKDGEYTYEFDEDVETLVALDIDTSKAGASTITPSQFEIRSKEHADTCMDLIRNIVTKAGYAPQTFGIDIEGNAQSGTALHIREKKSFGTRSKKQTYWQSPLEKIMTAMIRLDAILYPGEGSKADGEVSVHFSDNIGNDLSTLASAIELLDRAKAVSTEIKISMLHPDWTKKQISDEVTKVKAENGQDMDDPTFGRGDFDDPNKVNKDNPVEDEDDEEGDEGDE